MQAIEQRETGGPEVLRLVEAADPTPGPGEVVVALHAAAVNRLELWMRLGLYPGLRLPIIPGADGAGEIAAIGAGIAHLRVGDAVVIDPSLRWGDDPQIPGPEYGILGLHPNGTYAQLVRVPAAMCVPNRQVCPGQRRLFRWPVSRRTAR